MLAYTDDVVILIENEQKIRNLLARLERYLKRKIFERIEGKERGKAKMMKFRKGGEKRKRIDWMWRGKRLEEVKKFKYLEYYI